MGVPPVIHFRLGFSINHPAFSGYPDYGNHHIYTSEATPMTPLQGYDAEPNPRSYSPLQQSDVMDGGVFVPPESVSLGRRLWNRSDRQVIVKSSLSVAVDRH